MKNQDVNIFDAKCRTDTTCKIITSRRHDVLVRY